MICCAKPITVSKTSPIEKLFGHPTPRWQEVIEVNAIQTIASGKNFLFLFIILGISD